MEDTAPKKPVVFIQCPANGGQRPAFCCIILDRYKTCRRTCPSLRSFMDENPSCVLDAFAHFESQHDNYDIRKFAGKNLPNLKLSCRFCCFIAKSERGLKSHMKRTHCC